MAERLYRTQVLLEPEQHRALSEIAQREGRSISDVVREMIREQLKEREQAKEAALQRDLALFERIRQHREAILAERGGKPLDIDVVEMINQMRDERDEELYSVIFGHRD
ncbi:MAG: ribbon-helix-helix protein, CopG family [Chloroflexi bacterium]|nr:ribbon-helix-helix protein, CopG family [Chloroflexota bacterium]